MKISPASHREWLEERAKSIGGSEISCVIGLNPYETPYQLFLRKRKEQAGDIEESTNDAMICGHLFEGAVAERWSQITERVIIKASSEEVIYRNPKYPWCHYSPDRVYWDKAENGKRIKGLLECKTTTRSISLDDMEDPTILSWFTQLQYGMGIMGLKHGSIAVIHLNSRTFEYKDFDFNEEFFASLAESAEKAFIGIRDNIEPALISSEDILARFPQSAKDSSIDATEDIKNDFFNLLSKRLQRKQMEKEEGIITERIKLFMQEKENLIVYDKPAISWRTNDKGQRRFTIRDTYYNEIPQE